MEYNEIKKKYPIGTKVRFNSVNNFFMGRYMRLYNTGKVIGYDDCWENCEDENDEPDFRLCIAVNGDERWEYVRYPEDVRLLMDA